MISEKKEPITHMHRFVQIHEGTTADKSLMLMVLADVRAVIFSEESKTITEVNLRDVGTGTNAEQMKDFNFNGLQICNARVALNSKFFAIGLTGDLDQAMLKTPTVSSQKKPRNIVSTTKTQHTHLFVCRRKRV